MNILCCIFDEESDNCNCETCCSIVKPCCLEDFCCILRIFNYICSWEYPCCCCLSCLCPPKQNIEDEPYRDQRDHKDHEDHKVHEDHEDPKPQPMIEE